MDNNTAAKIVRTILENAPREFYEQEAQARGEAGSWAEAKALAMFAMLTPAERAQALDTAPSFPSFQVLDPFPDAPVDFTPMKGDPRDLHFSGEIYTSVEDDPQYRQAMGLTPEDRL